ACPRVAFPRLFSHYKVEGRSRARACAMELPDRRVKAIFDEAMEIDSTNERAAYLDQACAEAPELRPKVEALLKAFADAGSFLSLSAEQEDLTVPRGRRPSVDDEADPNEQAEQAPAQPPGEGPG